MWELLNDPLIETGFPSLSGYGWVYVPFNFVEAAAWMALSVFVLVRYVRRRRTWYELQYAASFSLFGITDLIEVHATTPLLLGFKAACLLGILQGRKLVVAYYPGAKI